MKDIQILVIDDDNLQRKSLCDLLSRWGHQVAACECLAAAREQLEKAAFDLILLDMRLPDGNGLEFLDEQKKLNADANIVIITAYADVRSAVAAVKCGAIDYLSKPFECEELEKIVRNASTKVQLGRRVSALTELTTRSPEIIHKTAVMERILETAGKIARAADTTVLILGESGTGKGLLAKYIHRLSARADKPFIDINCSAIPESLMESELFGYERGAFTDAKTKKIGLLEAAEGGTVFLDEIGDMTINLQSKILKVIEEKEFRPLGSARSTHVDIRVITATSRNLQERIGEGKFREDLYYRLSVVPITLPPLRERPDCIALLADHYRQVYSKKMARTVSGFSDDAVKAMLAYDWPGNVRELSNVVERSVILASESVITGDDLGLGGKARLAPAAGSREPRASGTNTPEQAREKKAAAPAADTTASLDAVEKQHIQAVLDSVNGNRSKAAEILKIHRTTLLKKIKEYQLKASVE